MKLDPAIRKVASALYCSLGTPRALSCLILLRAGEWGQLATMATDPTNYLEGPWGAEAYRRDAQASDFLRKSPLLPSGFNRREAAVAAFWESEKRCHETNLFLDLLRYPSNGPTGEFEGRLRQILTKAQKIAKRILGPLPSSLDCRFGPGTSFELKGQTYSTFADKLWITPHVTESCRSLFEWDFYSTHWGKTRTRLGLPLPRTVRGNRFTTVPKDSTKDRGICVEPLGNLWIQLGIGSYWKRRLSAVGLHVDKSRRGGLFNGRWRAQPSREEGQQFHQRVAREGSLLGNWATIDLSNASDTVAYELVRWVIPPDWFELLCAARSPFTLLDNRWVHLSKFSSMGNGFTFELESLVFACIISAATGAIVGDSVFVYGDDILIPTDKARDAMAILTAVGFQPNPKKSFLSGPFRESCGGDFFSGIPVRSYFADGRFESPLEWISMHNRLLELWPQARLAHRRCIDNIPSRLRVFGPRRLGDTVLTGRPLRFWVRDGIRWVATINPIPDRIPLDRWGSEFTTTLALLGADPAGLTPPRRPPIGYRISEASIS